MNGQESHHFHYQGVVNKLANRNRASRRPCREPCGLLSPSMQASWQCLYNSCGILFYDAIIGQAVIIAGWTFLGSVFVYNTLTVPDSFTPLIQSKPTETTWVITLIATLLAIATTTFLSIAFKEALRHRMYRPISLVQLNDGIALARSSFLINVRHLIPTLITLGIFGLTELLVSRRRDPVLQNMQPYHSGSWATLLTPTLVSCVVNASGWEPDLTSSPFELLIQGGLDQSGGLVHRGITVHGNASELVDISLRLSSVAGAQYGSGTPAVFNFNGVKYNISTGGILPAAPSYGGVTQQATENNTGLAFAGGLVPTHLDVHFPGGQAIQGLSRNYSLLQQGLTANVTCRPANSSSSSLNLSSSFFPTPVPLANGAIDYSEHHGRLY